MKAAIFGQKLRNFAKNLETLQGECGTRLAEAIRENGNASVAATLSRLTDKLKTRQGSCENTWIDARKFLSDFRDSLSTADKRSSGRDFSSLFSLIDDGQYISVEELTNVFVALASHKKPPNKPKPKTMDTKLVQNYLSRLEKALKEGQAFEVVFKELANDANLRKPELIAIATEFMGRLPQSASRAAVLKRIHSRYDALQDYRAKKRAFGGRTAA